MQVGPAMAAGLWQMHARTRFPPSPFSLFFAAEKVGKKVGKLGTDERRAAALFVVFCRKRNGGKLETDERKAGIKFHMAPFGGDFGAKTNSCLPARIASNLPGVRCEVSQSRGVLF